MKVHKGIGADVDHELLSHLRQTAKKSLVSKFRVESDPSVLETVRISISNQFQSEFLIGLVLTLIAGNACFVAPYLVSAPALGEIEPLVDQHGVILVGKCRENAKLTVIDLATCPAILS